MPFDEQLSEITRDLGAIAERLDDLSLEVLREAVRGKQTKRPELDRRLTRARRAIERATVALGGAELEGDEED